MKNRLQFGASAKIRRLLALCALLLLTACVSSGPSPPLREQAVRDYSAQARADFAVGDFESAINLYSAALRYDREVGNRLEAGLDLINLAVVYRAAGRLRAAQDCLDGFQALAGETGGMLLPPAERRRLKYLRAEADWFQAVVARDRGEQQMARSYLEKARAADSGQLRERIRTLEEDLKKKSQSDS